MRWTANNEQENRFKEILTELYSRFCSRAGEGQILDAQSVIPKILHFIWLDPKELPALGAPFIHSWQEKHPGWAVELWDDARAASFLHSTPTCRSKGSFDAASNFGMKSDILRYEILYHYGGVYADVDYECLGNLDQIVDTCNFFAGIANVPDFPSVEINNGLIGCCPQHSLMDKIVKIVSKDVTVKPHQQLNALAATNTGPSNDPTGGLMAFLGGADALNLHQVIKSTDAADTISTTGPGMLTKVLCESLLPKRGGDREVESELEEQGPPEHLVIFPPEVFNPVPNTARVKLTTNKGATEEVKASYIGESSLAVHYWQQTWQD